VQWVLFGYSLAFGNDIGHFVGDLSKPLFDEDEEMGLDTTPPSYSQMWCRGT